MIKLVIRIHDTLVGQAEIFNSIQKYKKQNDTATLLIFHWSSYYVMLCKYENTQQMVNPDRNKNKDKKSSKS